MEPEPLMDPKYCFNAFIDTGTGIHQHTILDLIPNIPVTRDVPDIQPFFYIRYPAGYGTGYHLLDILPDIRPDIRYPAGPVIRPDIKFWTRRNMTMTRRTSMMTRTSMN